MPIPSFTQWKRKMLPRWVVWRRNHSRLVGVQEAIIQLMSLARLHGVEFIETRYAQRPLSIEARMRGVLKFISMRVPVYGRYPPSTTMEVVVVPQGTEAYKFNRPEELSITRYDLAMLRREVVALKGR